MEEGFRRGDDRCRNVICCLQKTIEELAVKEEEEEEGHTLQGSIIGYSWSQSATSTEDFLA